MDFYGQYMYDYSSSDTTSASTITPPFTPTEGVIIKRSIDHECNVDMFIQVYVHTYIIILEYILQTRPLAISIQAYIRTCVIIT